ncbi:MAG: hypothetical protein OEP45_05375, partial [Acidobacteriota bacterium]|nr:hypothetical protein [Acidobacteriota bacterium]
RSQALMATLLLDRDLDLTRYCGRLWPIFARRTGIFSPLERLQRRGEAEEIVLFHPDPAYERLAAAAIDAVPFRDAHREEVAFAYLEGSADDLTPRFSRVGDSEPLAANRRLAGAGAAIVADLELLAAAGEVRPLAAPPAGVFVVGRESDVYLHPDAELFAGTVLDVREGPVVIAAGARVGQLSYVAGPSYVGPGTHVENCRLVAPVVLGRQCRVGGEIEASFVGDYSNKHHEGFLGHSLVGRWVNVGALATTSDLKNNYGEVRLEVPTTFLPRAGGELARVATGSIKFGSIVADCVKIAIGLRLNAGTVLDVGSNVFGGSPPRYLPPFSWGTAGARYELDRFLADCEKIFARRGQSPSGPLRQLAAYYWKNLAG